MLNSLNVKDSIAVIVAVDTDEKVRLITESIRNIDRNIPIVVKVSHQAQMDDLEDLEIKHFLNENEIVAHELIEQATHCALPIYEEGKVKV
jgi:pyruvate-formate lyase-activating enzyme